MIPQSTIDQILTVPILDVVKDYVELKRNGLNYTGLCPFHTEKSPSFSVSPVKNIYKCFGCSAGGGPIKFVMEKEKLPFAEACRKLAKKFNIPIQEEDQTPEQKAAQNRRETLYVVNSYAAAYFKECILAPEHKEALAYARSRWTDDTLKTFEIGFAPDSWDGLLEYSRKLGIKTESLIEAGLLKESQKTGGKPYDFFRGRLMIPLHDKYGRTIGFTGRNLKPDSKAKYLNSPESPIYQKGKTLFGLNWAAHSIKEQGFAYLVEGNADVIRLHQLGILETIGSSGTGLTLDQVLEIKKLCSSVTLIGDTDLAGQRAVDRSAKLIIGAGMNCNVVKLPSADGQKADPDSFFTDPDQVKEFVKANIRDYIIDLAQSWQEKSHAPDFKLRAIEEICFLISKLNPSGHEVYIDQVSRLIKPKKAWKDKLKEILKDSLPESEEKDFKRSLRTSALRIGITTASTRTITVITSIPRKASSGAATLY